MYVCVLIPTPRLKKRLFVAFRTDRSNPFHFNAPARGRSSRVFAASTSNWGQALKASTDMVQQSRPVGGNIGFLREVLIFFGERLIFFGERLALCGGRHLQSPARSAFNRIALGRSKCLAQTSGKQNRACNPGYPHRRDVPNHDFILFDIFRYFLRLPPALRSRRLASE